MNKYNERELAEWMHDNYEEIAKENNWETQKVTKVPFNLLPIENQRTMVELARRVIRRFVKNEN